MDRGQLGPVDLILVTHAHTDHFDYPTLRQLQSPKTIAITAKNTSPLWQGLKFQSIEEMHWGTFKLSNEPMGEPIARLRQAAAGQMEKIAIQEVGATNP